MVSVKNGKKARSGSERESASLAASALGCPEQCPREPQGRKESMLCRIRSVKAISM